MNNIFIDVDYAQIYKHGQKIGGDVFLLSRNPENNQIVATLSDGLGSGVKANVLASLTAHMAHKLSFSPISLEHSAEIIMDTLPVCKERKISYSTFTIADIHYNDDMENIAVNLIEYDNPASLRFSGAEDIKWDRTRTELKREGAFKKETIAQSSFKMDIGERLVMFSDGVTQSGLGKSLPLGWRLDGVRKFIKEEISANPDISSRELSRAIVQKACALDGFSSKDDITCVVVYIRRPRRTLIVTGPPFTKEADEILGEKIRNFNGKKIVSGGTTAQIVARLFGKKLKVDLSCWSPDVPPASKMEGIDPSKMYVVSVMPCIAKKFERQRPEMKEEDLYDVDNVITTRELARMIKQANIEFEKLEDGTFDDPMGEATGAGAIFGTTGGVMEAALRTAQDILTGENLDKIDFEAVRGGEGIKRATVNIAGKDLKVVAASGLANARTILEEIKSGKADYQFVEIMACPGGCIMGGGQPIKSSKVRAEVDVRKLRADALYTIDEKSTIRKSHENPALQTIYRNYLGEPGGELAHKLLHTSYTKREKYNI